MHIKLTNGVPTPYTIGELRRDNPNVSFPRTIPDTTLAEYDVYPVAETPRPEVTYAQNVEQGFAMVGGAWTQTWTVVDASAGEIAQRTQERADDVRDERNRRLAASDWTQVDDAPLTNTQKAAWAAYRQGLRDVPSQEGFPWDVSWPIEP
jgi:hypothetical protein